MAIGYDYRCPQCPHEWTLFTKRFTLGPVNWGETKHTCFSCQTFLSVAASVDANSWLIWQRNHKSDIEQNIVISQLASSIEKRLNTVRGLTPIELHFDSIECPTCHDVMSTVSFGEDLMKCPECGEYSGEFDNNNGISIYGTAEGGT